MLEETTFYILKVIAVKNRRKNHDYFTSLREKSPRKRTIIIKKKKKKRTVSIEIEKRASRKEKEKKRKKKNGIMGRKQEKKGEEQGKASSEWVVRSIRVGWGGRLGGTSVDFRALRRRAERAC